MKPRSALGAIALGVVLGGMALGTSGCATGFFLYELFAGDDDDDDKKDETDAGTDVVATAPTTTTTAEPAVPDAGPCTVGTRCATATSDAGMCALDGVCEEKKSDGETCAASWECAGGYCAWDGTAGRCSSTLNVCKTTQTGCTAEPHACCEGSRCRPAEFGALPQCEVCSVKDVPCDSLTADKCCSKTCSFGRCQ